MSKDQHSRVFALLDNNGNGYIEHADLLSYAAKAGTGDSVTSKANGLWASLASFDDDADGRVSKDEFVAGADLSAVVDAAVELHLATLDTVDADNDDRISREEWATINSTLGISRADSDSGFDDVDADKDGYVTRDEFAARVRGLYGSDEDLSHVDVTRV